MLRTTRPLSRLEETVRNVIASRAEWYEDELLTPEAENIRIYRATFDEVFEWGGAPVATQAVAGQLEHPHEDHAALELVALAKAGDEAGFRELAACVMPLHEIDLCWAGTRRRLGLASAEPAPTQIFPW